MVKKRTLPVQMFQFPSLRQAQRFQKDMADRGLESIRAATGDGFFIVAVKGQEPGPSPHARKSR
jgi:hypothetical protein